MYSNRAYEEFKLVLYVAGPGETVAWAVVLLLLNSQTCLLVQLFIFYIKLSQREL